jgi:3-hydroxybutyryl-CoA dehydrogenase
MTTWECQKCDIRYNYELDVCSYCQGSLIKKQESSARVSASTKVLSAPLGHEDVPYWVGLLESKEGAKMIHKQKSDLVAGSDVSLSHDEEETKEIVGVLGAGIMGQGLVEHLLLNGHRIVWVARNPEHLKKACEKVFTRIGRSTDARDVERLRGCCTLTDKTEKLGDCDLVIEAIVEEVEPKVELYREAEKHMRQGAILATNTSGLSLESLSAHLTYPENFGALHFFNPVTRMQLVETALCSKSSETTSKFLDDFARRIGKTPIRVAATPAFAVNRALMPLINEVIRELEEGVADAESIDEAIRLGLNHPMGPLALADLIGLDVCEKIMNNLAERTGDSTYAPRPLLSQKVAEGKLGRKTSEGFYTYRPRPVTG